MDGFTAIFHLLLNDWYIKKNWIFRIKNPVFNIQRIYRALKTLIYQDYLALAEL